MMEIYINISDMTLKDVGVLPFFKYLNGIYFDASSRDFYAVFLQDTSIFFKLLDKISQMKRI